MKNRLPLGLGLIAVILLFAAAPVSAADGDYEVAGKWSGFWTHMDASGKSDTSKSVPGESETRESVAIEFSDSTGTKGRFIAPAAMEFSKATFDRDASGSVIVEGTDPKSGKLYRIEGNIIETLLEKKHYYSELKGTMKVGDVEGEVRLTNSFLKSIELTRLAVWIRESPSVYAYAGILLLHTIGMALVFGLSGAIALRVLGLAREMPLAPLVRFFPILWTGFLLNAATGGLLLIADITKLLPMPDFWTKLVFIALAIVNLKIIKRRVFAVAAHDERPLTANSKVLAFTLMIFWLGAVIAGRLIAYYKMNG